MRPFAQIIVGAIALALVSRVEAQSPSVSLSLSPATQDVALGAWVTLNLVVTPQNGAQVTTVSGRINYPRTLLHLRLGDSSINTAAWVSGGTLNENVEGEINLGASNLVSPIVSPTVVAQLRFGTFGLGTEGLTMVTLQESVFGMDAYDQSYAQLPIGQLINASVTVFEPPPIPHTPTITQTATLTPTVGATHTRTQAPRTPTAARSPSPTINYADECL